VPYLSPMKKTVFILLGLLLPLVILGRQASTPEASDDVIAQLQARLDSGEAKLDYDSKWGYLPSVLKNLKIPISSQTWVFSKTSLQIDHIAPWSPRAVYFNDDIYVGSVQNGPLIEIGAADPKVGGVFYTLSQTKEEHPAFERQSTTCLLCHSSSSTLGVPGFLIRSVYTDRNGSAIGSVGADIATDRTPIKQRWGGWYLTGKHSEPESLENWSSPLVASEIGNVTMYLSRVAPGKDPKKPAPELFDTTVYLSPHSDAVALMVLTHQTNLHNLITVANQESRRATSDAGVQRVVERLVHGMLFAREAPLSGRVQGSSNFAQEFSSIGPRDHKGRSLRDFDLQHRLFKYPLSYLVYSPSFDALPDSARHAVYQRFIQILQREDDSPDFENISQDDRRAIMEILVETKPEFAQYVATVK